MTSHVAQQWIELLRQERWDDSALLPRDYMRLARLPRWWKIVYDIRQLSPNDRILEVGCGSGHQLIPLAAQGFRVTGIDVSAESLERCRRLVARTEEVIKRTLAVDLVLGDFAQMPPSEKFPLVFSFGVIEHFLDHSERLQFLRRLTEWTAPGGACVNYVPNGMHPLRQMMREKKLGGYAIPEIDYGIKSLAEDMLEAGFVQPRVVLYDLFGYRLVLTPRDSLSWLAFRGLNLFFKLMPDLLLPLSFRERHAYILAIVARKPA